MRKSFKQQQDYFIVNILGISSNQRLQFQQQKIKLCFCLQLFWGTASNYRIKMQELSLAESAAASRLSRCVEKLITHESYVS